MITRLMFEAAIGALLSGANGVAKSIVLVLAASLDRGSAGTRRSRRILRMSVADWSQTECPELTLRGRGR